MYSFFRSVCLPLENRNNLNQNGDLYAMQHYRDLMLSSYGLFPTIDTPLCEVIVDGFIINC